MVAETLAPPPSWKATHPTVAFRVDLATRARLDDLSHRTGRGLGEIVREALGVVEARAAADYARGFADGSRAPLEVPCARCAVPLRVPRADAQDIIRRRAGLIHRGACPPLGTEVAAGSSQPATGDT